MYEKCVNFCLLVRVEGQGSPIWKRWRCLLSCLGTHVNSIILHILVSASVFRVKHNFSVCICVYWKIKIYSCSVFMFIPVRCQTPVMSAMSVQSLNKYSCTNGMQLNVKARFFFCKSTTFCWSSNQTSLTFLLDLKIVSRVANCINSVFTALITSDLQLWVLNLFEGGVRVCGDAVLRYFWCGFAVIFILTRGIAVSKH